MSTDAIRHHLFSIIALLSFNKVGCSNLGLSEDPTQEPPQTNEWKILKQLLNSDCPIEICRVFSGWLILLCTAVFFNAFVFPKPTSDRFKFGWTNIPWNQLFGGIWWRLACHTFSQVKICSISWGITNQALLHIWACGGPLNFSKKWRIPMICFDVKNEYYRSFHIYPCK